MKYKYKSFNVEPYLNILESEKFESYLYKIVYNGKVIFVPF